MAGYADPRDMLARENVVDETDAQRHGEPDDCSRWADGVHAVSVTPGGAASRLSAHRTLREIARA
jgi:hypothetical protein